MREARTPTLDRFRLHPFGGYCTCFSKPYQVCTTYEGVRCQQERWKQLSPKQRKMAEREIDRAYSSTSNQDGR